MRTISVETIKAEFDEVIASPTRVQEDGRDVAIILSPDLYDFCLRPRRRA